MNEVQILGALVVVIIALCQAIKYAGVSTRWIPLIAIVFGIAGSIYFGGANWLSVLSGVIIAFTSSGVFSAFKRTILDK